MANDLKNQNDFFDFLPSLLDGRLFKGRDMMPSLDSFKADIKETDTDYEVKVDLPGYEKDNISIDYHQEILTVKAERQEEKEEKHEEDNYIRQERSYGTVSRQFYLTNVKEDNIKASYEDGVLHITLPKQEEGKDKKRITIE